MADKDNNANIIDCSINKSRRVVRSIREATLFDLIDLCDSSITFRTT